MDDYFKIYLAFIAICASSLYAISVIDNDMLASEAYKNAGKIVKVIKK